MAFPYETAFREAEKSLIQYGSQRLPPDQIRAALDRYKTYDGRQLSDEAYFSILIYVVFYSGFRAAIVDARSDAINRWFGDCRKVADYTEDDVAAITSDPHMIRHRQKIPACIENAKAVRQVIEEHGSFGQYVASFNATESFENMLLLKEALEARFQYLGGVTVFHFLTDIGMPVLKPDRVICRIFCRLGLTETDRQVLSTVIQGQRFSKATGLPSRYIDIVFAAYGQVESAEFGIDRGICLDKPRCPVCGLKEFCREHQEKDAPSGTRLAH